MRILFAVLFAIFLKEIRAIPLNETFIDFEENAGLFTQLCQPGIAMFQRDNYSNHFFPKPDEVSQQFFTSGRPACIQTPILETSDEVEVVFHMFRFVQPASELDVFFINSAGIMLKNETFMFDKVYNWTEEAIIYPPTESFRIRLIYRSQTEGTFFAINSITINLNDYTPPIQNFTGCMKEDTFPLSSGGQFFPCSQSEFSDFLRMQYSNTTRVDKPLGANDYFLTVPNHGQRSCMEYPHDILLMEGTEVILSIYTNNEDGIKDWATLFAFDSMISNTTAEMIVIEIDNSRNWRKISLKMKDSVVVKLRLYTQDFSNAKAFIAIDSIGIKDSDSEDCTNNCQCTALKQINTYASIENQGSSTSFGLTTIIVSTTVVVSLIWGVVITVFVYRKRRISENNSPIVNKD